MNSKFLCLLTLLTLSGLSQGQRGEQQVLQDRFSRYFFSPEFVMQNEDILDLSNDQRAELKSQIRIAQNSFLDLQSRLQEQLKQLTDMIKQPHPDEHDVMLRLQRILDAEGEIKRVQLRLLVRIKNELTPEQQAKLEERRKIAAQ